jgi:hypothetical protein
MEIKELVAQFESCTLPKDEWNHTAHLRVALYYLFFDDYYVAISKIRCGIIRYNQSIETENACSKKYHETITMFWITEVKKFIDNFGLGTIKDKEEGLLDSQLVCKDYIFKFYNSRLIESDEARAVCKL